MNKEEKEYNLYLYWEAVDKLQDIIKSGYLTIDEIIEMLKDDLNK